MIRADQNQLTMFWSPPEVPVPKPKFKDEAEEAQWETDCAKYGCGGAASEAQDKTAKLPELIARITPNEVRLELYSERKLGWDLNALKAEKDAADLARRKANSKSEQVKF